jgi:hypothetical protein
MALFRVGRTLSDFNGIANLELEVKLKVPVAKERPKNLMA